MRKFGTTLALILLLPLALGAGEVFEDVPSEKPRAAAPAGGKQPALEPREEAPKAEKPKPRGRILEVKTARGVVAGRPLGVSRVFSADVNPIYVWFRFAGIAPDSRILAKWYYLETSPPHALGMAEAIVLPGASWGQFNYELAPGKKWPAGVYRVDLYLRGKKAASVRFRVQPAKHAPAAEEVEPDQPAKEKPPSPAQEARRSKATPADSTAVAAEQAEIQRRRRAKLDFTQALDEFNAGRYAKSAQLFQSYLAVFPEDGQARKYLDQAREQVTASKTGTLKVTSAPPARIYLDGRLLGPTPLTKPGLPVGRYQLQARAGGLSQSHDLKIQPRTTTTVEFNLKQRLESAPAPAKGKVFVHPKLGFKLQVPPGWRADQSRAKADLRLRPPAGEGMIQVDFKKDFTRFNPKEFSQAWEKAAVGPGKTLSAKVSGRESKLGGLPAYEGVYEGSGVKIKVLFIKGPKDFALLSGIFPDAEYAGGQGALNLVINSFKFP